MRRRMQVVAGPPGSGKSTLFPVSEFGIDSFNADDRAAELNGGSYHGISPSIRSQVNGEFERFVNEHIDGSRSFALETTLRSEITFDQARRARERGFFVTMLYVALEDVDENIERIAVRAQAGGHSASDRVLRAIHKASLANLPRALREMDALAVYDNSNRDSRPALVMKTYRGRVIFLAKRVPAWVQRALHGTDFDPIRYTP